jgi:hypothetical protein
MGPSWVTHTLGAVMIVTALYSLSRVLAAPRLGRSIHYDQNIAHGAMGFAMAAMLVTSIPTLPTGVWEGVFAILLVWFLARAGLFVAGHRLEAFTYDDVHHVTHHLAHSTMAGAMLYMYFDASALPKATTTWSDMVMSAPSGGAKALVPFLFVFVLLISAIWHADGLTRFVRTPGGSIDTEEIAVTPAMALALSPSGGSGDAVELQRTPSRAELRKTPVISSASTRLLAPRLEDGCHIAMCITMGYMLVLMR